MPERLALKRAHSRRLRPQAVVLWLLCIAVLILFGTNIREQQKTDALARALATYRQDSERQITELHQAQSASLEQGLIRLDQLTADLQKTEEETQREAQSLTNRMRSELSRTVEQRHQEMIKAISDLRADVRAASARPNHNGDVEQQRELASASGATLISSPGAAPEQTQSSANAVMHGERRDDQPVASATRKKTFWSKLNPFSRKKKPQDGSPDAVAQ